MRFSRDAFDTQHLRAMAERLHWHRKPSAKAMPLSMRVHLHRAHSSEHDDAEVMKVTAVSTAVALAVVLAALLAIGFGSEMARWMGLE
ncbi:hypothetical protein [Ralstonia mannitolilytica]|uniref:Uncharacterized protein n=1 Tax=Ralstonia mannitolilytica TaxID=105219 RepID=A0AAJ5D3D7_9RALS|nr:hypothetical protein [Ralstonia mannitolilytica]AJW43624.1 hypothetical protein TK49_02165 [Ralstonia mannitolilytica]QIF08864.1 hypothetical protein G5A69_15350 [Ralstonia mannitolilytica]CAG2145228.1 hypothetical protein LMG6866_02825 [Ralstonia mannitolilytica]CAJ0727969.1 hypothetical protein R76706_01542 [Ralstonia mannitolilytica]CAJ0732274.1 hypothetical protein R77592_02915 [Ralstonia mannitolilytica]